MLLPVILIFSMIMVSILIGFSQSLIGIHLYENELAARFLSDYHATSCVRILVRDIVKNPYSDGSNMPGAWQRILPADGNGFCLYSEIEFVEFANGDYDMVSFELISNMSRSLDTDDLEYMNVDLGYSQSAQGVLSAPVASANSLSRKYKISMKFKDGKIDRILMRI